jgi:prephenate dehydratase
MRHDGMTLRMTKKPMATKTDRQPLKNPIIAFQGEPGAFSHAAARKLLGEKVAVLPCIGFRNVFEALSAGHATHAVIPVENTLHGSVLENYDYLLEYGIPIVGETSIRISHQLIAMPGVRFRDVVRVLSHPVALSQCRKFFLNHPRLEMTSHYDTAGSVKTLQEKRPERTAAIASEAAAQIYGGTILRRNIEDDRRNFTRFVLLSRRSLPQRKAAWKTSLVFSVANKPGALFKAMACFALRDVNLIKIESRPLRGSPWEYHFYVDLNGSINDPNVEKAVANLGELTNFLRLLGSYQPTA